VKTSLNRAKGCVFCNYKYVNIDPKRGDLFMSRLKHLLKVWRVEPLSVAIGLDDL